MLVTKLVCQALMSLSNLKLNLNARSIDVTPQVSQLLRSGLHLLRPPWPEYDAGLKYWGLLGNHHGLSKNPFG